MSRVSATRREAAGAPSREASPPRSSSLGWVAAGAAALLAAYLLHPLLQDHRLPIGPDGPVYVWWERVSGAVGLDAVRRPGVSGLGLVIETVLRADALTVVTALEPVLAVATALAGAALAEAALGADRLRAGLTGLVVGAFAAFLAPGWLANLGLVAMVLTALAAFATAERSWRGVAVGGALVAAAAVTHALFLAVSLAVIAGALVLLVPSTVRRARAGEPLRSQGPVRIAAGALAGAGLGGLGLLALSGGPRIPGDSSQDHFLRRLGLDRMLRSRFLERFAGDVRQVRLAGAAGLGLGALLPAWARRIRGPGWRLYLAVAGSWALVTLAGVLFLRRTGLAPAGRMLNFAYFVPLLAGAAAAFALRGRIWIRLLGALLVVATVVGGFGAWYRRAPYMTAEELRTVGAAVAVIESLPPGSPLVFVVDTGELAAGFHISRFGNVIRAGLPGDRITDARFVVGSPSDALAGRPGTTSEDPEYTAISEASMEEARPILGDAAIFVLEPFNAPGWQEAARSGIRVAGRAVALRLPGDAEIRAATGPAATGSSPWVVTLAAVAILALLGLLGAGWSRWGLVGASDVAVFAAAPAIGAGLAVLAVLVADRLALPTAPAGTTLAALLAAAGHLLGRRPHHHAVDGAEHA